MKPLTFKFRRVSVDFDSVRGAARLALADCRNILIAVEWDAGSRQMEMKLIKPPRGPRVCPPPALATTQ